MQSEDILKMVAERCASLPPISDASFNDDGGDKAQQRKQLEMAQRHHVVQEILLNEVYLGGNPSLVEECGFGKGEKGYVRMQVVMAEHQSDPMVAQYVGSGEYRNFCAYSVMATSFDFSRLTGGSYFHFSIRHDPDFEKRWH